MAGHGIGVAFGVPCGLDLKSQSLVIESFSVGSRAILSTMGEVLAAAGSKSFMASFLGSQRKQHMWRNLLQVLARELNHLKQ